MCQPTIPHQKSHSSSLGPLFVDFGEVCLQSVCLQKLEMTNNLSAFVWVQLEVDCSDLQVSSPLSHVLPPHSQNSLLLIFQSSKLGRFYRLILKTVKNKIPFTSSYFTSSPTLMCFFWQILVLHNKQATLWTDSGPGPGCPISSGAIYSLTGALPHFHYARKVRIQELHNYPKPAQPCCRVLMEESSHRKWQYVYNSTNYRY